MGRMNRGRGAGSSAVSGRMAAAAALVGWLASPAGAEGLRTGIIEPVVDGGFGQVVASGDFHGDGRPDLAVASAQEGAEASPAPGAIFIFNSTDQGIAAGIVIDLGPGARADARRTLATGDFNGDGFDDLAVGAPGATVGNEAIPSGAVFMFEGSMLGLLPNVSRALTPSLARDEQNEPGDAFGSALATADINGDGRLDLAVGAPGKTREGVAEAGVVFLFRGSPDQVVGERRLLEARGTLEQTLNGFGNNEAGDRFGDALAAADFDGDGTVDLAVGAPGEAPADGPAGSGLVFVFRGMRGGFMPDRGLDQGERLVVADDRARIRSDNESGDRFGSALATGDFNGDGTADLAVAAPGETLTAGAVFVFRGAMAGLEPDRRLTQDAIRLPTSGENRFISEPGDRFGSTLAVGDFDGDMRDDLAIGMPGDAIEADLSEERQNPLSGNRDLAAALALLGREQPPGGGSGFVLVFRGGEDGLRGSRALSQLNGFLLLDRSGDHFGLGLAAADMNGDGRADLAVGAPGKTAAGTSGAGVVFLFGGTDGGLRGQQLVDATLQNANAERAEVGGEAGGGAPTDVDIDRDAARADDGDARDGGAGSGAPVNVDID